MICVLAVGFVANELIKPVNPRHHHIPAPREAADDHAVTEQRGN